MIAMSLKHQFERELNDPRIVDRAVDHAETCRRLDVLHLAGSALQVKLRVVPNVEELSAEIEPHALVRQREMLDEGEIGVYKTRPGQRSSLGISKFASGGRSKGALIEPVLERVHLGRGGATWIRSNRSGFVGIANLVGTVQIVSVPGERHTGGICTVYHEERETGSHALDDVHLPVPSNGIHGSIPVGSELLSFSEWQVVSHAGGELMTYVQLRQAPVRAARARKREIGRAGKCAQPVWHSGVIGFGVGITQQGVESAANALGFSLDL